MTFGMMPIRTFGSYNYCSWSPLIGNSTTSFSPGGNLFGVNNQFSSRMDWSFLKTSSVGNGTIGSSGNWLSCMSAPPSFNFNLSFNSGFKFNSGLDSLSFNPTNPFAGNSAALMKFFGITAPPIIGISTPSFGSVTGTSSNSNSSFVPTTDYAENAARVAEQELAKGVKETSKNDSVDIRRYKNGARNSYQWCAYFTSYCFGAGQNKKPIFGFTGSSQHIRRQAEKAGVFASKNSGYTPKRGDIAIWTNIGDPNHGHVGVVTKVYPDGSFDVIEGNSSNRVKKNHYKSPTSVSARFAGFAKMSEWAA